MPRAKKVKQPVEGAPSVEAEVKAGDVKVVWPGGSRVYSGPDAKANAEAFASKDPNRKVV